MIRAIGSQLSDLAVRQPEAVAITATHGSVTYAELERRANRTARAYSELGVGQGDVVTIGLPNGVPFVVAAFAVWKLGATPQPVSHRLPLAEIEQILELSKPVLVVGLEVPGPWTCIGPDFVPAGDLDTELEERVSPIWKIMTSGGSTGRPKLIVANGDGRVGTEMGALVGISGDSVLLAPGPLYHNTPFVCLVTGLLLGAHVILPERFDPEATVDAVKQHRVTVLQLVPTMMSRILRYLDETGAVLDPSSLTMVWHAAAKCPDWLKRRWIDLVGPEKLMEMYGGTELVSVTTVSGTEWLKRPGTVGTPLFGEMSVRSEDGETLPPGEVGEIYMRGPAGAPDSFRYIGAEAKTLDGWITVGDLGWMDEEGYLYISDRRTDMIVAGGRNIYPAEVEGALEEHPGVVGAVVVGLPDDDLGQTVHAVVHVEEGTDEESLRAHMAERLVSYKLPRSYSLVDTLLRDDAGKVRRAQVRDKEISRLAGLC